uniref:BPTI/Kunitz inhibitor domain-containing protein n=1 Tax=Naja naja TaxID=35670 RepID=A0A8C6XA42_NAJNA
MNFWGSFRGTVCFIFFFLLSHVSPVICQLPKAVGWCKALFPRFYFNAATGNCEKFLYGGCGGNKNNFITLEFINGAICKSFKMVKMQKDIS